MSIISRTRPQVKPTRKTTRPVRPFGEGIFPVRERRMPYTAADLAWAAYELNKNARDYDVIVPAPAPICGGSPLADDRDWESMYRESYAQDCLERGLIPSDVAELIARSTLVGHDA